MTDEPNFWRFMRPVLWGPAVLILIGLAFYGISAAAKRSEDALRAAPVRAVAEVVSVEHLPSQRNERRRDAYRVTLRLPGPDGVVVTRSVGAGAYAHARGAETVEIWQQADDPGNFQLVWEWDPARPGIDQRWIGAGPLVGAVLLLGWLIYARLPAWRAVSAGARREARIDRHPGRRRVEWTGLDGKPHTWTAPRRQSLPAVGTLIPVAIDPETGREFHADPG